MQRKPLDERWDPKYLDVVNAVPWKGDENGEKEPRMAIKMDDREGGEERTTQAKPTVPRNFYIKSSVLQEHGYSAGCPGVCRS